MTCKKPESQGSRLLRVLKRGWTSPLDALREVGTLKLSTRVGELRKAGHRIADKWSDDGRFKVYRLTKAS